MIKKGWQSIHDGATSNDDAKNGNQTKEALIAKELTLTENLAETGLWSLKRWDGCELYEMAWTLSSSLFCQTLHVCM
jgi:hypothetical protein